MVPNFLILYSLLWPEGMKHIIFLFSLDFYMLEDSSLFTNMKNSFILLSLYVKFPPIFCSVVHVLQQTPSPSSYLSNYGTKNCTHHLLPKAVYDKDYFNGLQYCADDALLHSHLYRSVSLFTTIWIQDLMYLLLSQFSSASYCHSSALVCCRDDYSCLEIEFYI